MPRAQRLSVDQRRARLLELGVELFSQRAFDQVSTDDIALAGGVSKGLLYHYFANKRGYYVATVRELARRVLEATQLDDEVPFEESVRGALARFVGFIRLNATFYRTLMRGEVDDEVQRIIDDARNKVVRRILERAGIRDDGAVQRVAVFGWAGFTESACLQWLEHEAEMSEDQLVDMMVSALLLLVAHAAPKSTSN
ncbi:MAG: TetR/AcrR family transcriptional regulator [Myxococcota bacterium]